MRLHKKKKTSSRSKKKVTRKLKKKSNPRTSRYKESLYDTALQFKNFDDFSEYYWRGYSRGIYWIGTNEKHYNIATPLEKQYARERKLVAYISPEKIKEKYAVEVDLSAMDPYSDVTENRTLRTNSIKVLRPNLVRILNQYTIPKAIEVYKYNTRYLPSNEFDLFEFWEYAQERNRQELEGKRRKTKRRPGRPKKQ